MQHSLRVLLASYKFPYLAIYTYLFNNVLTIYVYTMRYVHFIQYEIPIWDLKFCLICEGFYFHYAC